MKKLMIGIAAISAGVAMADVTSANIVGYANKATEKVGKSLVSGSFATISSATGSFKLSDLSVTGYDEGEAYGEFGVVVLDNYGATAKDPVTKANKAYYWCDNEDVWEEDGIGWYDFSGSVKWDAENIEFSAGQAFWIQGAAQNLVSSGSVWMKDVAVATERVGKTAIANPFPSAITLKDMAVSGYDEGEAYGEFGVIILDNYGATAKDPVTKANMAYYWCDNEDVWEEDGIGWYDFSGSTKWDDATSFPMGQGFWVQGAGQTLEFTNPNFSSVED